MLKLSTFLAVRSIELYYNMLCYKTTWVYLSGSSKVPNTYIVMSWIVRQSMTIQQQQVKGATINTFLDVSILK